MRAIVQGELGGPEVLRLEERDSPDPIPTEVRVRVHAAGVNPVDLKTRAGKGMASVLGDPPFTVGWDVAGEVTEIAPGVTRFRVGDEVLGMPWFPREAAAYAEEVTAPARHFIAKPNVLSFVEAGALPLAGLTAWQIVVETLHLQAGDDVLIHGAAGGVGHLAVQIAAARGANVFATARAEQADFLAGLGAARTVDYREERFEDVLADIKMDAVIDFPGTVGERSLEAMRPGATLVSVPSGVDPELAHAAARERKHVTGFLVEPDPVGLGGLVDLIEAGKLRVEVAEMLDLTEAAEAHRRAEAGGRGPGKIVLRVP